MRARIPHLRRAALGHARRRSYIGQDAAAQIGQGRIADRTAEHLGYSDRGVIQVRKLWLSAIEAVTRGDDPPGILRDLKENEMLHFDVVGSGRLVKIGEMVEHRPRILRI